MFTTLHAGIRVKQTHSYARSLYFKSLAPECRGKGCHVVLTVPPGGATFDVAFVAAEDESMRVLGTRHFVS